jgi:hypothetical protein
MLGGLALGGGARRGPVGSPLQKHRAARATGGAESDLDKTEILAGEASLKFPPNQAVTQKAHHELREKIRGAYEQYLLERGSADLVSPPASANAPDAGGWAATDPEVVKVTKNFGSMCDLVRGDPPCMPGTPFQSRGAWPDMPWNNGLVPGDGLGGRGLTRWAAWCKHRADIKAALETLEKQMVFTGTPAPSAAMFADAAGHAGTPPFAAPVLPAVGARPSYPGTWGWQTATHYENDNTKGADAYVCKEAFKSAVEKYTTPVKADDILELSIFDVPAGNKCAQDAIDEFDAVLGKLLTTQARTYDQRLAWVTRKSNTLNALLKWAEHLAFGEQSGSPLAGHCGALKNMIYGDPAKGINPGSLAAKVSALQYGEPSAPFAPKLKAPVVNVNNAIISPQITATKTALNDLVVAYASCRNGYLLHPDWADATDPRTKKTLKTRFEKIFVAMVNLLNKYSSKPTFALRVQAFESKKHLLQAIEKFGDALVLNVAFKEALSSTDLGVTTRAAALQLALKNLPPEVGKINLPESRTGPKKKMPAAVTAFKTRGIPIGYEGFATLIGRFLKTVFNRNAAGPWDGIRHQYNELAYVAKKIDSASVLYDHLARDATAFATEYYAFADTGDRARFDLAERAKAATLASLQALLTFVTVTSVLVVGDATITAPFTEAVDRVRAALADVRVPSVSNAGAPRGVQAARPLLDSQRLISNAVQPTETIMLAKDVASVSAHIAGDAILEAPTTASLEEMIGHIPAAGGPRLLYGLVVDRPGDMTALYKAVAIDLKMRPPASVANKVADRKKAATGWLYEVVRLESGAHFLRLRCYINPELYAV